MILTHTTNLIPSYPKQVMRISYVNTNINTDILNEFRNVIYSRRDQRKNGFSKTLEDAISAYIVEYSR